MVSSPDPPALAWPSAAHALTEPVAYFKNVAGHVGVHRDSGTLQAAAGTAVRFANRLVAARGATAGIAFKDGTLLTLGPGTELRVHKFVFEPREARYAFSGR